MQPYIFVNYTTEDFEHKFNGHAYRFPAGTERVLEEEKARHFAKHLTDRELQKAGVENILDPVRRKEVLDKCLKAMDMEQDEDMPEEDRVFEAKVKATKKKPATKKTPKKSEEDFEGLND